MEIIREQGVGVVDVEGAEEQAVVGGTAFRAEACSSGGRFSGQGEAVEDAR